MSTLTRFSLIVLILFSGTQAFAQKKSSAAFDAFNTKPRTMKEIVQEFCDRTLPRYNEIMDWIKAHKKDNPEIPVPPALEPDCHDCNKPEYDGLHVKFKAWFDQICQPEKKMIEDLLQIDRDMQILGYDENGIYRGSDELPRCISKVVVPECWDGAIRLVQRIYSKKVLPMAKLYRKDPSRAYMGISALNASERTLQLLIGREDPELMPTETSLVLTYFEKADERLRSQFHYRIYPAFLNSEEALEKASSGQVSRFDEAMKILPKMYAFMHFNLHVTFEAEGHGPQGEKLHALATAEKEIRCRISFDTVGLDKRRCTIWEGVGGDTLSFRVHDANFLSDDGFAVYTAPATFDAPFHLNIAMCDQEPTFVLSLLGFGAPDETYTLANGLRTQQPFLNALAQSTLGSANMSNAMSNLADLSKRAQDLQSDPENTALLARLRAHKGDKDYFKTDQGIADSIAAKKVAKQFGDFREPASIHKSRSKYREMEMLQKRMQEHHADEEYLNSGQYEKDFNRVMELQNSSEIQESMQGAESLGMQMSGLMDIRLPFSDGSPTPVDGNVRDALKSFAGSKGTWDYGKFTIKMEQHADESDPIK